MTPIEFLTSVLADTGSYCVAGLGDTAKFRTYFCQSITEVATIAEGLAADNFDVYFAMATYKPDEEGVTRRRAHQVEALKSFWLDIDCGPNKPYADHQTGLDALTGFCIAAGLPTPLINNSGNGWHAFWILDSPIDLPTWKPVAERFKAVCIEHGLQADYSCTADAARVLRVPGTLNHNRKTFADKVLPADYDRSTAKPVSLYSAAAPVSLIDFALALGVPPDTGPLGFSIPAHIQQGADSDTRALMGRNNEYKFSKIILLRSEGCAQLNHIVTDQASIEEPLWRAGLSIAALCVDKDKAIHKMSSLHPSYTPENTEHKASLTKGPYLCSSFASLNPSGCDLCPHKGTIKSPIVLGKCIAAAPVSEVVSALDSGSGDVRKYEIPEYPFPFFRGKHGGIYRKAASAEDDDVVVYENDFYVLKRLRDPELGEVLWCRLHLPRDGVRDFSMPLSTVMAKDRFRDCITAQGMAVMGKTIDELMFYVARRVKELQLMGQAGKVRSQFGWTDDDTFIIGDREITPTEIRYSPPSAAITNMCALTVKQGSLAKWSAIANFYDRPGMEAHAFTFLLGFGSALMPFTQARGGIVNLLGGSGAGKSTVQMMVNSIWGKPFDMLLNVDDTQNARIHRFGVLNNLPATIDEVTNMRDDAISQLAYAITQGRGKNRMESQSNSERINNTMWRLLAITSSNSSLYDKLSAMKAFPEGEMMRLIELTLLKDPDLPKDKTDAIFGEMHRNYGHAGEAYMQYVVAHKSEVLQQITDIQKGMDARAQFGQRERFWSIMAAVALTGGSIANKLGLISFDIDRIASWAVSTLGRGRATLPSAGVATEALGEFISENFHNILIIHGVHTAGLPNAPIRLPRNELVIRFEPDTKVLYIAAKRLREWCAKNQVSFQGIQTGAASVGLSLELSKKRMSAGTGVNAPPSAVVVIRDPQGVLIDNEALKPTEN